MFDLSPQSLERLELDLGDLASHKHLGKPEDAWLSRLDMILPSDKVSTNQWATDKRLIKGRDELPIKWTSDLTPYVPAMQDAMDMPGVNVVAIQGNARSGKTVSIENHVMKRLEHGPWGDVFWYMQSESDVEDYMEERGEWMLEAHEAIAEKIDKQYRRNARDRKRIGESLALWMPATKKTTRGKGAPLIVADEIDAYQPKIMKGLLTLLRNRQREFGSAALLILASHPDAGPKSGISSIIDQGIRHLWWFQCPHPKCRRPFSPAAEANVRLSWNVGDWLKKLDGVEKADILDTIEHEARLVCPHCHGLIDNDMRLEASHDTGIWLQGHQKLIKKRTLDHPSRVANIMGFCIHAFQTPFIKIGGVAREFVAAKLEFEETQDDTNLREVTVKTLGEVYQGAVDAEKTEDWKVVKRRMQSGRSYLLGTVPREAHFLTAFVDIQSDRFEVRVIAWSQSRESWLIDAFSLKEWRGGERNFDNLSPFTNLADWEILEHAVLRQTYPLAGAVAWHMPIAKVAIDLGGMDDATTNARVWSSGAIARKVDPIPEWQILLHRGSAYKTGELYGIPKQVMKDDRGGVILEQPVWERTANVHQIKRIIATRQKIAMPGPGFMNAPQNLADKYFREIVSEQIINGEWLPRGRNETWDAYVACETARASLQPERDGLDFDKKRPVWARPFRPGIDPGLDLKPRKLVSHYSRLLALNMGVDREER